MKTHSETHRTIVDDFGFGVDKAIEKAFRRKKRLSRVVTRTLSLSVRIVELFDVVEK